jgi:hypothetical protein
MQIGLEGQQADALCALMIEHQHEPVLMTKQGDDLYVAFAAASYTISPDGGVTEEDFG